MNSIERIVSTLKFEKPDRIPVIAQVFGHAATVAGMHLGDYIRNGELLARGQITALDRYGYDAVFALMDTYVETEAVGSVLTYFKNQYPIVKSYALSQDTDPDNLTIPDPHEAGRMPALLNAAGILREEVGDEVMVVGCVLGPLTVTTQLLGIEKALYLAIDDPERFSRILDFATEVVTRFGKAQIDAGVHLPVVFDPSASPAVVPPMFFYEFELPRLKRLFLSLKEHGAAANWLHIAGPAGPILPFYPEAGVDIANFDYSVSPSVAQKALTRTVLDGNIKSWSFVEATPEEITHESTRLMDQFVHRGGFILSSGCEIPVESRQENVAAMVMSTRTGR